MVNYGKLQFQFKDSKMRIGIGADHGGYEVKEFLKDYLRTPEFELVDFGTGSTEPVDYPDYANKVCESFLKGNLDRGILICGSGLGMSMAANRHHGVRAALCHDGLSARLARRHTNANILVLGARLLGPETILDCIRNFLDTDFEGGRHERRVCKLD
jgi:ribose 5-phosphate isomerase B